MSKIHEFCAKIYQEGWEMSVLCVQTILSKQLTLKKMVINKFFGHEWKKFRLSAKFSPSSFNMLFICPEEEVGDLFSGRKFLLFLGFEQKFCGLQKETSSNVFKSAFQMTRGTFYRKAFRKKSSIFLMLLSNLSEKVSFRPQYFLWLRKRHLGTRCQTLLLL